ncbi:MAG: 4-hydroxy-tetrahydrodipicolinate synthase [Planctomycetaceae bacterium]|jgi:4-hydroxy-tetrahydrodipicolinate synthase|nr:4-hydroxy-tetrahydrodipicolinate synthase [Planctomycetaceae bacterium]
MTRFEEYAGLSTAIITPFKNNNVDYETLQKQVEFQIAAGTTAVVPAGTTGESPTLSFEEHENVLRATVEAAAGKIKVLAGTGANCTQEALDLTRFAKKAGVDAALIVAPYYNKPTQEGFYMHFKTLAESVDLPICIYNIPGRCAKNIEPETILRLSAIPNIGMVKEASGSMDQASAIMANSDLTVLSGDDSLTLPLLAMGARGVISVVGNIIPQEMVALCRAFDRGDWAAARQLHYKTYTLCRDMLSLSTNPIPVKSAMKMLGRDTGELRLPMTPLTAGEESKLRQTLAAYGLLPL